MLVRVTKLQICGGTFSWGGGGGRIDAMDTDQQDQETMEDLLHHIGKREQGWKYG